MLAMLWILGALALLPAFVGDDGDGSDREDVNQDDDGNQPDTPDDGGADKDPSDDLPADLPLKGSEEDDSLNGGLGDDTIYGFAGDDVLQGNEANDMLYGGLGDDTLLARDGGDTMIGGRGNDGLFGGDGSLLDGGQGDDILHISGASTVTGGEGADLFETQQWITEDRSPDQASIITDFDPTQDQLRVFISSSLQGDLDQPMQLVDWADGKGADLMFGDQVLLRISGAQGMDPGLIHAEIDLDLNFGAAGAVYQDGALSSIISGGAAQNEIYGGAGNDQINVDFSDGKEGQDSLGDLADGGVGDDTLTGQGGDSYFDSNDSDDTQGVWQVLQHEDSLFGGAGDDVLVAKNGSQLTGGDGADRFEVVHMIDELPDGSFFAPARITDFEVGSDSLLIEGLSLGADGVLSVQRWINGQGANVLLNGVVVAEVAGGQDLVVADLMRRTDLAA